jgi:DNA (cytosine-5)-methyltransferase 1
VRERTIGAAGAYSKKLPDPSLVHVIDFFCGCGGMSYGFKSTRQSHLAYNILAGIDIDDAALATYACNVGAPAIKADIAVLAKTPESLRDLIPHWVPPKQRPLVFVGCAPCQGFSALRKGDERDDGRNGLMAAFAKIAVHYKPEFVVLENVPEILKGRFAHYYKGAARSLRDAGYLLTEAIVDFSLYGVPQRRRRAIVLGGLGKKVAMHAPVLNRDEVLTVRDAIEHLRPLESGEADPFDVAHRAPNHTARLVKLFRAIPPDGGDRRALPEELKLQAHAALDKSSAPGFTDVYGRLRWDSPAVTITAKSRSASSGRFLHPEQHRNITVREAALLQGFPQHYVFDGAPTQLYRQIGEAVPPLFARFVAWSLLDRIQSSKLRLPPMLSSSHRTAECFADDGALRMIDAFCGAGGLSLGFSAAGFRTEYAFDIDHDAVRTYRQNISTVAEVRDITGRELKNDLNDLVGAHTAPFCVVGGPPCQGFSHQRRGSANDPRNLLVLHYAGLIGALHRRPTAVILENVTDLDLPRGQRILAEYEAAMTVLGYTVVRHNMNSAAYAVPQLRNRIVLVAVSKALAPFYKGPKPLTPKRWRTVGETLLGLPDPTNHLLLIPLLANHIASREGPMNRRRIAHVDMGYGRTMIPTDLQLPCHASDYRGHRDVYGRLDWFSQARTITGGFDSYTRGEFGHPFMHRSITPREAARLQGFPDWFEFYGNRAAVRRQIGNAVPPPMAFAIAAGVKAAVDEAVRTYGRIDPDLHVWPKRAQTNNYGVGASCDIKHSSRRGRNRPDGAEAK